MKKRIMFYAMLIYAAIYHSSCATPIRIMPGTTPLDSLQAITAKDLSRLNGDYEIYSTNTGRSSSMMFTYSKKFDFTDESDENAYVNLRAINDHKIKATLFNNGKVIRKRKIRGNVSGNYFYYKMTRYSVFGKPSYVFGSLTTQSNRIGLTKGNNIIADTDYGGFLVVLIVPTFGSCDKIRNIIFHRTQKADSNSPEHTE